MNIFKSSLLFLLAVAFTGCMSPHNIRPTDLLLSHPRPFTVMTYNIRTGLGAVKLGNSVFNARHSSRHKLKPIIEAIESVDPDIIGLQEVLGIYQAAELAEALNMNYAYTSHGILNYGTWWGVTILSKFPIQKISRQVISSGYSNARTNLIADISIFGKNLVFFCVHKDVHQTGDEALNITMKQINENENIVILMGDLNILPEDERFDAFTERMEDTAFMVDTNSATLCRTKGTYPSLAKTMAGKRIDYVLVDKGQFEVLDVGLTGEKYWQASDHRGYYAKLSFTSISTSAKASMSR